MKDLMKINELTKEQLQELDTYYSTSIEELLLYNNDIIISFVDKCERILNYSLSLTELKFKLTSDYIGILYLFDEKDIESYKKDFELIKYFNIHTFELGYTLGDFYNEKNDLEQALYYYGDTFKEGFDLGGDNYYYSLVRYLNILNENPSKLLIKLINKSNSLNAYSKDYINTYLLLIINLDKYSDLYIKYINEAIEKSLVAVRKYQENNKSVFSDTDEERNLCELLSLKMEYYVHYRKFEKAYEIYKLLTEEIGKSDCTRYYHARDKIYYDMIRLMSEDYPNLKYFDNISFAKFKLLNEDFLKENQIITLEKEDGLTFDFKVVNINDDSVTIVPILPLLGEGGNIYITKNEDNGTIYLINKFSNSY